MGRESGANDPENQIQAEQMGESVDLNFVRKQFDDIGSVIEDWRSAAGGEAQGVAAPRPSHRVNVQFSEQAYKVLADLAREEGKSLSEVLRDALKLERFFHDLRKENGRVLVERDGKVRELLRV